MDSKNNNQNNQKGGNTPQNNGNGNNIYSAKPGMIASDAPPPPLGNTQPPQPVSNQPESQKKDQPANIESRQVEQTQAQPVPSADQTQKDANTNKNDINPKAQVNNAGNTVNKTGSVNNQTQTVPKPIVSNISKPSVPPPPPPVSKKPASPSNNSTNTNPPKPKRKFPKFIIIALAVLLLVGGGLYLAFNVFNINFGGSNKQVEITWWGLWEDSKIVDPLIADYESKNPNVKIKYVGNSPQDYRERLTNAFAKGEGPDIFRFHNTWVPMFKKELDNVPNSVMSASNYAENYYPVITSDVSSGSGFVGIPLGYDALTLFINQDIFESEGVSVPTNWNEVRETAKRLTKKEDGVITRAGIAMGRTENVDHWPEILGLLMFQNGANPNNPNDKLAEDALEFYTIFSNVDGVWDETLPPSTVAFSSGKLAMYIAPSWRVYDLKRQNPDLNFKTVPVPQVAKVRPDDPDITYATYWIEGVWSSSANKQAAWDFLGYLSQKENLQRFYQNATKVRGMGEVYPRSDMQEMLLDHPILGSIAKLAPDAQSWYLASRTFDGATGINSQINSYYEDAINAVNEGGDPNEALGPVVQGVRQVLSQYGLVR